MSLTKFIKKNKSKLNKEFIRFLVVGVVATAIHYSIYLLLLNVLNPTIAYTVGYAGSFCCNFLLTNLFTFRTHPTVKRGVGFVVSHAINYGLHIILLNLFLSLSVPEEWAPVPVYIIAIPVNFLLIRFAFKSKWTS